MYKWNKQIYDKLAINCNIVSNDDNISDIKP